MLYLRSECHSHKNAPPVERGGTSKSNKFTMQILKEPAELGYLADQERIEEGEAIAEQQWSYDRVDLEGMVRLWGTEAVLREVQRIHAEQAKDGSQIEIRVLSKAYLTGGYDDPNPTRDDDEF